MKDGQGELRGLGRTLDILEAIASVETSASLTTLAAAVDLPKSTAYRLLTALAERGYVDRDGESGYRPTLKLVTLGNQILNGLDLRAVARPILAELMHTVKAVVHLCVIDGDAVVYIDKLQPMGTQRMYSQVGRRSPLHCTGVGKVALAGLPDEEVRAILERAGTPAFTVNTMTQLEGIVRHLARVREQGFATDDEEHEPGIRCVAAPIRNFTNAVVASISVSGPTNIITRDRMEELAGLVMSAAEHISSKLGYGDACQYD